MNQKIGVLIETLIRTSRYCTSHLGFQTAIGTILQEFHLLKYPPSLILNAFEKASRNENIDPKLFIKNRQFVTQTVKNFA